MRKLLFFLMDLGTELVTEFKDALYNDIKRLQNKDILSEEERNRIMAEQRQEQDFEKYKTYSADDRPLLDSESSFRVVRRFKMKRDNVHNIRLLNN